MSKKKKECMLCGNTNAKELVLETFFSDGDGNECEEMNYMCKEGEGCCQ